MLILLKENPKITLLEKTKDTKCGVTKFKYLRNAGNWFQKPAKTNVWGPVQCYQHTDCFAPAHPPVGQKTSLIYFKHKITTLAN